MPSPTERPAAALEAVFGNHRRGRGRGQRRGRQHDARGGRRPAARTRGGDAARRLARGAAGSERRACAPTRPARAGARGDRCRRVCRPELPRNPPNRCFFCKANLYGTIAAAHRARPSAPAPTSTTSPTGARACEAAEAHGVRHPYVEAGIDKAGVRALARSLGLDDLAELPAAALPLEPARDRDRGHGRTARGWSTRSSGWSSRSWNPGRSVAGCCRTGSRSSSIPRVWPDPERARRRRSARRSSSCSAAMAIPRPRPLPRPTGWAAPSTDRQRHG